MSGQRKSTLRHWYTGGATRHGAQRSRLDLPSALAYPSPVDRATIVARARPRIPAYPLAHPGRDHEEGRNEKARKWPNQLIKIADERELACRGNFLPKFAGRNQKSRLFNVQSEALSWGERE